MKAFRPLLILGVIAITTMSGCSMTPDKEVQELPESVEPSAQGSQDSQRALTLMSGKNLRVQSIENAYYAYYFQKAVFDVYGVILEDIEPISQELDSIFDFKELVYKGGMLPPVIEESKGYLGAQSERSLVKTARRWQIIKPARVVVSTPTWQEYLFTSIEGRPSPINSYLKPALPDEVKASEAGKEKGLVEGAEYANAIFKKNIAVLKRDYTGMLTFKKLEMQGVVDTPILAVSSEPFIYSKGNKELSVDTEHYLITKESTFQKSNTWKPMVSEGRYYTD